MSQLHGLGRPRGWRGEVGLNQLLSRLRDLITVQLRFTWLNRSMVQPTPMVNRSTWLTGQHRSTTGQ
ncbi:hypothetical protein PIB30_059852, partial [Stylosanthes scabra]|nr:hypothetical protein [Stylosanthes scabra]